MTLNRETGLPEISPTGEKPKAVKILVIDDDRGMREVCSAVLASAGYDVATEEDGMHGLLHLAITVPDVILCDLNMPRMSGFEFLSAVRRRFPQIRVVAMSGAYLGDAVPGGVLADAFYSKGQSPTTFIGTIEALLKTPLPTRQNRELAAVWIPLAAQGATGKPFAMVTCPECFRTFPLWVSTEETDEILSLPCLFCDYEVRYSNRFPRATAPVEGTLGEKAVEVKKELALEQSAGAFNDEIANSTPLI